MARKSKSSPAQTSFLELTLKTAPCVPAIREAVKAWVAGGYKGATPTTKTLLNYWFKNDHRVNGLPFKYHYFQREAMETLIYLYEVAKVRRFNNLIGEYAPIGLKDTLRLLQYDDYARYCVKMATGSGKTKVIALAVAWQYFNAVLEDSQAYAATSLIIAPNVIVFERLKEDFEGGRIFRTDPIIPRELEIYWDMDFYMRGDGERAGSQGAVYVTNIHQLYERTDNGDDGEPDIMTQMLGRKPPAAMTTAEPFEARLLARGGPLFVVNDEAHHTHDENSEWLKTIRRMNEGLIADESQTMDDPPAAVNGQRSAVIQLDMSATPRYSKGSLFTWTVFDYPLKQAILDNVVKRPYKGVVRGMAETPSDIASVRYQAYLTAGVERWREYREQLTPLGRKPVLFVMMNSTKDADDVADYLRTKYPAEFAGERLHVIHTNKIGDVSVRDEDDARQIAADIDKPDSPVNCIVSVLMLREGWDVQSVTVVVGLRPYTAKANILPEQTIGRGLRLMFRGNTGAEPSFRERVDVIGNNAFIEFVEELEKEEEMAFESFEPGKDKLVIETIFPDPDKAEMDITIPELSALLERKRSLAEEIAAAGGQAIAAAADLTRKLALQTMLQGVLEHWGRVDALVLIHSVQPEGNVLDLDGKLAVVMSAENIHPGKGTPVTHLEMRRIADGVKVVERYRTTDQVEKAFLEESDYNYLYEDEMGYNFMQPETFDQIPISKDILGDQAVWLQEGMTCKVMLHEGKPVSIELPQRVTLEIVEADPVVKGQTASSSYKPAKLSNGARVMVPPHIGAGTRVVVMTADGSYVERAKD